MSNYVGQEPVVSNLLRDYFAGNGSQTVFPMSFNPTDRFGIVVFVNGVMQPADNTSYTVSGLTLTFLEAPARPAKGVATNIEVIYLTLGSNIVTSNINSGVPIAQAITSDNTAYTASYNPIIIELVPDMIVAIRVSAPNSGGLPTFNPDELGAKTIRKANGVRLLPGDLSYDHLLIYDQTLDSWILLNPTRTPNNAAYLTNLVHPTNGSGWKDVVNSGWLPSYLNQQWGGGIAPFELVDNSTNVLYKFDSASASIQSDGPNANMSNIGQQGIATWIGQGFKVGKTMTLAAVWIKVNKFGNPTNNLELYIFPDDGSGTKPTGSVPITNGTATAIAGKKMSSDEQWHRFTFPTPPTVNANTQYHITVKSSGPVDGTNYWRWMEVTQTSYGVFWLYPYGPISVSSGVPTWSTGGNGVSLTFIIEPTNTSTMLQPGGQFEQKLVFSEGIPITHSNGLCQPLANFFDDRESSFLLRGSNFTKDKTICDFMYGIDHDRIVLRCNASTGFPQIDIYDSTSTRRTVTGTVDISSGYHDVGVWIQSTNSGTDRISLFIDGALNNNLTGLTFGFNPLMKTLGTAWLGGGFNLAPTWTQKLNMNVLPSADSPAWTFTGNGVQSNMFLSFGGKLYQTGDTGGFSVTGYYEKTTNLSNTNGWTIVAKVRIKNNPSINNSQECTLEIKDGTKKITFMFHEQHLFRTESARFDYGAADFKSNEHVLMISGKGSDLSVFLDGKLLIDSPGTITVANVTNSILFGDNSGATTNSVWDYFAYYDTAIFNPQFTSGELSEFAYWSGDARSMWEGTYNSGTPISVRKFLGMSLPYVKQTVFKIKDTLSQTSVTSALTGVVPIFTMMNAQRYVIGSELTFVNAKVALNATAFDFTKLLLLHIDGSYDLNDMQRNSKSSGVSNPATVIMSHNGLVKQVPFGLHKCDLRISGANTGAIFAGAERSFEIESKA